MFTKYWLNKNVLMDEPRGDGIRMMSCPLPANIIEGTFIYNVPLSIYFSTITADIEVNVVYTCDTKEWH